MKARRVLALILSIAMIMGNSLSVTAAELPQGQSEEVTEETDQKESPSPSASADFEEEEEQNRPSGDGELSSPSPTDKQEEALPTETPEEDETEGETSTAAPTVEPTAAPAETATPTAAPSETPTALPTALPIEEPAETISDEEGNLYTLTDETVTVNGEKLPVYVSESDMESREEAHGEASMDASGFYSSSADKSSSQYYWAYYNQIGSLAQQIYDELADKYTNFKDPSYVLEVSVDSLWTDAQRSESIATAIAAFNYDHPEAFWLYANALAWGAKKSGYDYNNDGVIDEFTAVTAVVCKRDSAATMLTPIYNGSWDAVEADQAEMESYISKIISEVNTKSSFYDKLAVINDNITYLNYYNRYVAKNAATDADLSKAYISASALTQQDWLKSEGDLGDPESPVCEAYSRSFKLICDRLGIPCLVVVGNHHMWNYVQDKSDGNWYAVDCTWDDPIRSNEYSVKETPLNYIHRYLLVGSDTGYGDETFSGEHPANGTFWVGGTPFEVPVISQTAYEKNDAGNKDGAWNYDETTHTLILTDYTGNTTTDIGGNTIQIYADGDLNLVLNGENTLSLDSDIGIYCKGDLNISGTGSIAIENVGTGIFAEGEIAIDSGSVTINAGGTEGCGLNGWQVTIEGGELCIYGETGAITASGSVTVSHTMVMMAGSSEETAQKASIYQGERYLKIFAGSTVHYVTGTDQTIASQTIGHNELISEPVVSLTGYSLVGWYTSATEQNEGTKWNFDTDRVESDLTLYAKWQANQYTVTFDGNYEGAVSSSKKVTFDSAYGELPKPVRAGFDFAGWYTAAEDGEPVSENSVVSTDKDHTLYAKWDMVVHHVTFKLEGGNFPTTDSVVFEIPYNQSVEDVVGIPENPVRTKYEFDGWFTASDGGEEFDFTKILTGDVNVYAQWTAKYKVAAPAANIADGTEVEEETLISLKSSTLDARIYYTTDGTDPSTNSNIYTDEIAVKAIMDAVGTEDMDSGEVTIKAVAIKENYADSEIVTFTYPVKDAGWGDLTSGDQKLYESPTDVPNAMWIAGLSDEGYAYTGNSITFSDLRVYDHKTLLEEKKDYTISYRNNRAANDASIASKAPAVIITGRGNYSGKIEKTFKILPLDIGEGEFSADDILLAQNNKVQKPVPVLLWKTTKLRNGADYTVSYTDTAADAYKAAGEYEITMAGKGNFTGTRTVTLMITEKTLVSKLSVASIPNQKYKKGEAIEPTLTVKSGSKVLTGVEESVYQEGAETDYTYRYVDNRAVGTASVVITGHGDYIGTRTVTFKITGTPLSSVRFNNFVSSYNYDGYKGKPVTQDGVTLTLTTGRGASAETYYLKEYPQEDGTGDYTVEYQNNILPGTATVIYTGVNGYTGTVKKTYKINGVSFGNVKINNFVTSYVYTGEPIEQPEKVTLTLTTGADTTTLVEDEDYSVSYTKNENAGTATVVYTGLGRYTGTQKKTFSIKTYDLNKDPDEKIRVEYDSSVIYAKGGAKPVPVVFFQLPDGTEKILKEGVDYTLSYANNSAVNESNAKKPPTIVLKGKGSFTGTRQKETFTIKSQSIENLTLTAPDKVYANKKNNFPSTPVITDLDGKVLRAGTDYDNKNIQYFYEEDTDLADGTSHKAGELISSNDIVPAGTVIRVQVTGKGYYKDTVSGVYRVVGGDIARASVRVSDQYFTGREVRPGKSQISVTLNGKLLSDQDYEITEYTNNINKGTAKITLRGIGDYGGSKTVNFRITDKSMYYIVAFNGNQATSGSMRNMQLAVDKEYTLTNNTYKRTNYEFAGWNTKEDGTGTSYDNKGIIRNDQKQSGVTVVLYAQWKPITYTITYHSAGGPNNALNTKTTYTADDRTFTIEAPEREKWPVGYQFGGWYKEDTYKNKISIVKKGSSGNLNLYAKWIPYTYTVSFDGNGATGGSAMDEAFSYGISKALTANKFKRTGYVFLGWALSPDAQEPEYADKERVCDLISRRNNVNGALTLYAVWKNQFRIDYVVNGGVLEPSAKDYWESYAYGKKQNLPTPTREGYTFAGWYKDSAFKTRVSSITSSMSGDLTLYAKWTAYNYTVVFNGNGNNSGGMSRMSMNYDTGKALNKNAFVKRGYQFAGWSISKDGGVQYADEEIINILPSKKGETITLYARWKPTKYAITYETNGGTLNRDYANYIDTYDYNHDGGYALPTPKRTGYAFAGWYKESTFRTKVTSIAKSSYGDLTLYAKWTASCLVTYHSNADDVTGEMGDQILKYETAAALRSNAFKRPGYAFAGWATEPGGEVVFTNAQKLQYLSEDYMEYAWREIWFMDLYAVWENHFTITYHANNGTDDSTETYDYGTGKPAKEFPVPVRDGYTFAGWYKDASFRTRVTALSTTSSGDMDLYAKWTGKSYKVTFVADAPNGKTSTGRMGVQTLTYGTERALTKNAFKVTGYTFLGWSTTPFSEASDFEKEEPMSRVDYENAEKIAGLEDYRDITLYGVWEKDVYDIVYRNMPEIENPNPNSYTVDDTVVLKEPECMGNTFLGWYTDAACRRKATDIKAGTTGNKTYYAKWSQVNYTLCYVTNGGILDTSRVGYVTSYGSNTDNGYLLPTATKKGYIFGGWYKEASFRTKVGPIIGSSYVDMTLYAKWLPVPPVTSFSLNTTEIRQAKGTQYQLTVTDIQPVTAEESSIEWESTNPEVASVDEDGLISMNQEGMAVIKGYANKRRFAQKCLVIVGSSEEADIGVPYLTPQMFRTCDDDDDTRSFNEAIKHLDRDGCKTLYVPAGIYRIDAKTHIKLRSHMNYILSPDAEIRAIGNSSSDYDIIYAKEVSDIGISGGKIIGERDEHKGTSGEWGMGIGIYDSREITITGVEISNCWGDGIYLGSHHDWTADAGCEDITITGCYVHHNRRNNLSIVCADYVTVENCRFDYAKGTAPEYGIDIETNNSNPCEHITISDSTFTGNGQGSIGIVTAANDITIKNCTLNGMFVNYAGTNVVISGSVINGEANARIGVSLVDGTVINDGIEEDDVLIATFDADKSPYTVGDYKNKGFQEVTYDFTDSDDSTAGKVLRLERPSNGTQEAGVYLNLSELVDGTMSALKEGSTYRFEYVVRGSGQWGIKTDQTGWYPVVPMSDKFSTGIVTYRAEKARACRLMLYAVDKVKGMFLEIDSIKIYEAK